MVCPCKYPILFLDRRDGEKIEYISIPSEIFDEGYVNKPTFEEVEEEGFDGEKHKYMAVVWSNPEGAKVKKYDVNDHIVIAGCHAQVDESGKQIACRKKEMYVVLHPINEWEGYHVVQIKERK